MSDQAPPTQEQEPVGGSSRPDPKRVVRSSSDKYLGGVSAGIADYFNIDINIVRVLFVVFGFIGGFGIALYVAGWILLPSDISPADEDITDRFKDNWPWIVVAGLALLLITDIGDDDGFHPGGLIFGVALVAAGVFFVLNRNKDQEDVDKAMAEADTAVANAMGEANATTERVNATAASATGRANQIAKDATEKAMDSARQGTQRAAERRRRKQANSSYLGSVTFGLMLLVAALLFWTNSNDYTNLDGREIAGIELLLIGAAALIGTFLGRVRGLFWLIPVLIIVAAVSGQRWPNDSFSSRTWTPASFAEVQPVYELGAGDAIIDLRKIDVPVDETLAVEASLGVGRLCIFLPPAEALNVNAHVGLGHVEVLGQEDGGPGANVESTRNATGQGTFQIEANNGVGEVVVSNGEGCEQ